MQSVLMKIADSLTGIEGLKVYHYWRPRLSAPFCIWAEDGEGDSLHANNRKAEQVITGTVDYFTKEEFDPIVDSIQSALNSIEVCGWTLNSVQYEDDTNLIHFEWRFEVSGEMEV